MEPPVDFVIVTALEEERDAVLDKLPSARQLPPSADDVRVYFAAELPATFPDGTTCAYRVILVTLLNMGRVEAATAAGDAIRRWQPAYVLLVGIAGGIAEAGSGGIGEAPRLCGLCVSAVKVRCPTFGPIWKSGTQERNRAVGSLSKRNSTQRRGVRREPQRQDDSWTGPLFISDWRLSE